LNPLSALYAAGVGVKNRLYESGVIRSRALRGPVVSVGNLSVGGSGKTPFVILLGELLKSRGIPFDVLSRGYGRKTRGVLEVNPDGSPEQFGDEPLLIARRVGCPVIVGENRYEPGAYAEKKFGPQLHILDDGFQHRKLARDFDIVLLSPDDLHDQPLPAGRLREPLSSLQRADAIVIPSQRDFAPPAGQPVWRINRSTEISSAPMRPVAFCGIARPQRFLDELRALGISPAATKFYDDHHAYTSRDIEELIAIRDQSRGTGFVTTEKDQINLGAQIEKLGTGAIARVRMELLNAADALDTMLRVIRKRKPAP
jgi:tetraacyldisaccharide 4'-kinase